MCPPQPTLAGFDFPIGVPAEYARRTKIKRFSEALECFGTGEWADFYRICDRDDEISLYRPFYPRVSSKERKPVHLLTALGVSDMDMLRRGCERQTKTRKAACSLFWTLGGNQVGRAAISGWRDVVHPAKTVGALLWPFDGSLSALSESRRLVICETYPAEAYGQIGLRFPPGASKRRQSDRRGAAPVLFGWASRNGVSFSGGMRNTIVEGFGWGASGEDQFDAALGLFGMIEVVDDRRSAAPESIGAINCEGWILGQAA